MKPSNEYENAIIVSDDILGSTNSRYINQLLTAGSDNNLDIYYLSQSYFVLPKRTMRNNSNKINLSNQTLRDTKTLYRDVSGYDMRYDQFKQLCRKSWEADYIYHGKKIINI